MNRTTPLLRTPSRIAALALALVATLGTLQSIDLLASRDHGGTLMARAASQVVAAAATLRNSSARRG
jgi:hypothetical protein